ncbi:hypothetical protein EQV77_08265 [Halobacillus fulvus]|nr:hypothetical protein EQV77_08265 [Halobacillus fulvus]
MDKKTIGIIVAYTLIMTALLLVTFAGNWNPSGYDYTIDNQTVTIEKGTEQWEVDVSDKQPDAFRFYVALSEERQQWRTDITAIALLLPFLLLIAVPERRPFKNMVPKKWYMLIVLAIAVIYVVYSLSFHVEQIGEIQRLVEQLRE